jgi:hypothetical protein
LIQTPLSQAIGDPIALKGGGSEAIGSRAIVTRLARLIGLLFVVSISACKSDSITGSASGTPEHGIGATVLLYAQTANDAIVQADIYLDGRKQGATNRIVNGTYQYWLEFEAPLEKAGRHRVGIKIVEQKYATVDYIIGGSAYGINTKTQSTVQVSFPSTVRAARVGDMIEVSVDVP